MNILVTGGTGSFGQAFIKKVCNDYKVISYSRDWQKQDVAFKHENVFYLIGDVRDSDKLTYIMRDVDIVVHASAIKCITACENNSGECLETNVIGTQKVIRAMKTNNIKKAILISTDKAVLPINTYGTSKKMAEKLWIANKYNVCRYGNVIGSSGSVLPLYRKLIESGAKSLPVTDERMTRFWYKMDDAIGFVTDSMLKESKGEIFIPKIPSIRIIDLCKALDMPYHIVGLRGLEKLHEAMIPPDEITGKEGYSSGNNKHFLTVDEIKDSIRGV